MKLRFVVALGIVGALTLSGCQQTLQAVANNPNALQHVSQIGEGMNRKTSALTEEQEIDLGQQIASAMLGARPLVDNPAQQRYVNSVGRWLANQSSRPDLPWRFGVIDSDAINAFAAPGGPILITKGLLSRLNSEAELAGVLAHEIAHSQERHHVTAMQKNEESAATKSILAGLAGAAIAARGNSNARAFNNLGGTEAFANIVRQGFFVAPLDRSVEYEADRVGLVIMARAGYDPYAYVNVMQTMQQLKGTNDSMFALLSKTHPDPADRIAAMEPILTALDAQVKSADVGRERFLVAMGRGGEVTATRSTNSKAAPSKAPAKQPAPPRNPTRNPKKVDAPKL